MSWRRTRLLLFELVVVVLIVAVYALVFSHGTIAFENL